MSEVDPAWLVRSIQLSSVGREICGLVNILGLYLHLCNLNHGVGLEQQILESKSN